MPSFMILRPLLILALLTLSFQWTIPARADVLLFQSGLGFETGFSVQRYDHAGNLVRTYNNSSNVFEESFDHFTMSPDGQTFYVFSNSLGFTEIYPFDVATGNYAGPSQDIGGGFFEDYSPFDAAAICCDFEQENAIVQGRLGDVVGNNIYVVSNPNYSGGAPTFASIKAFDTITGNFLGSSPFLDGKPILDMRVKVGETIEDIFSSVNQLVLSSDGIYSNTQEFFSFPFPVQTLNSGFSKIIDTAPGDRALLIGPDNLLYITNSQSHEVRRYTLTGGFVDMFLTSSDMVTMTPYSVQFATNGDLYLLGRESTGDLRTLVKRFDGTTSNNISTTFIDIDPPLSANRFYILIPEPASLSVFALLTVGFLLSRPRNCQLA